MDHKPSIRIREARVADIAMIVAVHVSSWNATYPNYHPKPTPQLRTAQWEQMFKKKGDWFCIVAENENAEVIAFASADRFHDPALPYAGELCKIHMYREYHRQGIGSRLVHAVAKRLMENGVASMVLFADPENPNIQFYERLGGQRIPDEKGHFNGAYGWNDLSQLVNRNLTQ